MTNRDALDKALEDFKQNPTYGHELNLMLMISIATSLACIADAMAEEEVENENVYQN